MPEPRGPYSRGFLPHIDAGSQPQFITWRLADSIPTELIEDWVEELQAEEEPKRKLEMYRKVETYLDAGHGNCLLQDPIAAKIVQDALLFYHLSLFTLYEWVIMPNHVHVLLSPCEGVPLSKVMKDLKGFTSSAINKSLNRAGRLWQPDYFDRLVRDREHFEKTAHYIRRNPVKAGLCSTMESWPYSSANGVAWEKLCAKKS